MEIRADNIFIALLLFVGIWLVVAFRRQFGTALGCVAMIGPGNRTEDQMTGAIVVGLICLAAVCITKILSRGNDH